MNNLKRQIKKALLGAALGLTMYSNLGKEKESDNTYRVKPYNITQALNSIEDKDIRDAIHDMYWNNRNISEGMVVSNNPSLIGTKGVNISTNDSYDYTGTDAFKSVLESREIFKEHLNQNLVRLYDALKKNPISLDDSLANVVIESQKIVHKYTYDVDTRQPDMEKSNIALDYRI